DVCLVDQCLLPWPGQRPVALPVEAAIDHHAARPGRCRVALVAQQRAALARAVAGEQLVPLDRAVDAERVRVEQQLGGIEPVSRRSVPPTNDTAALTPRPV